MGAVVTPSVTVVITNFDYGRFIGAAISSALAQRGNVEIIVVDDGSTDGSAAVIDGFGARITPIFTENRGQAAAFNTGWRAASGDVVMFLDADDVVFPATAETVSTTFADQPQLSRVQFPLELIDADGCRLDGAIPPRNKRLFSGDALARLQRCPDDIVWQPTSGNAFSRRALARILPMPESPYRICADYYLSSLAPLHGPVAALVEAGGAYRVHGANNHFTSVDSLGRLRDNIVRTNVTHRALIDECNRLGIVAPAVEPEDVLSVTSSANRLVSLRLDRASHPVTHDTRWSLVRLGVRSALARADVGPWRRALFAMWFVAAAVVPRSGVRRVAHPYLAIEADR